MAVPLRGVIHGNTIELQDPVNLPDGQEVTVLLQPAQPEENLKPGEGLRRSFGGWCDDVEGLDKYLEWNRQQRKQSRRDSLE